MSAPAWMWVRVAALAGFAILAGGALAQESKVTLKDGPGRDKVNVCMTCHSLDYIQMNSAWMNEAAWKATVNKMINALGAPVPKGDVDAIVAYLVRDYGK